MNFLAYVYHLWRMKFWILIIAGAAALLAFYLTSLMSETYKAEALIFVKRAPNINPMERLDIHPPVFQELLTSDVLLTDVIEEYNKRYPNDSHPFKRFRKRFRVSGVVLTETAVQKDYSPIVNLTATAGSPESASYLVNTWQQMAIVRYGDLIAKEQELTYRTLASEMQSLDAQIMTAQQQFSAGKWQLAAHIQELSNWLDLLAPGTLQPLPDEPRDQLPIEYMEPPAQFNVQVADRSVSVSRKGLRQQLVELHIEIAALNEEAEALRALLKDEPASIRLGGPDLERLQALMGDKLTPEFVNELKSVHTTGEQINPHYQFVKQALTDAEKQLRAKKAASQIVGEKIAEVEQKIATLQKSAAELEPLVQHARREIEKLLKEKALIMERLNMAGLSYKLLKLDRDDPMDTSTLFSVVPAAAPYRIGPRRLTYTGLVGIAAVLLVTLMVITNVFVADLEAVYGRTTKSIKPAPAAPASAADTGSETPSRGDSPDQKS